MYGFMVGQNNGMLGIQPGETYTDAKMKIKEPCSGSGKIILCTKLSILTIILFG